MMRIEQLGSRAHVELLCELYTSVWPNLTINSDQVFKSLNYPESAHHIAIDGQGALAGFISAFPVYHQTNQTRRWQLDLLGTQPDHRQKGVAKALLSTSIDFAKRRGFNKFESVIREKNIASEYSFSRLGFTQQKKHECVGYRRKLSADKIQSLKANCEVIEVSTFVVDGIWLEEVVSFDDLNENLIRQESGQLPLSMLVPEDTNFTLNSEWESFGTFYKWQMGH